MKQLFMVMQVVQRWVKHIPHTRQRFVPFVISSYDCFCITKLIDYTLIIAFYLLCFKISIIPYTGV